MLHIMNYVLECRLGWQILQNVPQKVKCQQDCQTVIVWCMYTQAAAQRKTDFELGVFADPIYFGQFPDSVRARIPYLPELSPELVACLMPAQTLSPVSKCT